ncbi:MAG: N-acetylneuraminate lyase [Rhodobacteraceae bacterium]|nr:N-acetylneuraminate lyase [Paracoccaceae bacterium]
MEEARDRAAGGRLSRLHAALMTPCDAEENISHPCLRRLVAHVRGLGIDGLYVGGSTGEGLLHSVAERIATFETVADAAGDAARIGHVGAISTRDASALARACAALGYDAVSAIPPIYFPHRKDAILGYYQDILSAAAGTPLIVYNIPAMSGVSFSLDDLGRLLELPGVAGIKQTSADMYQMEQLARAFPHKVLLNGYDEMLLAGLAMGAGGGVGSTYNILGDAYLEMAGMLAGGRPDAARAIQSRCNAVIDELVRAGVFPGLKYILHRMGVIATPVCRRPLATLAPATCAALDRIADRLAAAQSAAGDGKETRG